MSSAVLLNICYKFGTWKNTHDHIEIIHFRQLLQNVTPESKVNKKFASETWQVSKGSSHDIFLLTSFLCVMIGLPDFFFVKRKRKRWISWFSRELEDQSSWKVRDQDYIYCKKTRQVFLCCSRPWTLFWHFDAILHILMIMTQVLLVSLRIWP